MKTPSELAIWDGDLSMKFHAHKAGASQGVSISQVLDLVVTDGELKTGDIVMSRTQAYDDRIKCNGMRYLRVDHPALADKLSFIQSGNSPIAFGASSNMVADASGSPYQAKVVVTHKNVVISVPSFSNSTIKAYFSHDAGLTFVGLESLIIDSNNFFIDEVSDSVALFFYNRLYVFNQDGTILDSKYIGAASLDTSISVVNIVKGGKYYAYCADGRVFECETLSGNYILTGYLAENSTALIPANPACNCFVKYKNFIYAILKTLDGSIGGIYKISGSAASFTSGTYDVFSLIGASDTFIYAQSPGNIQKVTDNGGVTYINNYSKFGANSPVLQMYNIGDFGVIVRIANGKTFLSFDGANVFTQIAATGNYICYNEYSGQLAVATDQNEFPVRTASFASTTEFTTPTINSSIAGFDWYIIK